MIDFNNPQVAELYVPNALSDVTIIGVGRPTLLSNINMAQAEKMIACSDPNIAPKPPVIVVDNKKKDKEVPVVSAD